MKLFETIAKKIKNTTLSYIKVFAALFCLSILTTCSPNANECAKAKAGDTFDFLSFYGIDIFSDIDTGTESSNSACKEERYCIDGNDWGFPKFKVSSESRNLNVHNIGGHLQITDWIKTGQIISNAADRNLVIEINRGNRWTPWYGGTKAKDGGSSVFLPSFLQPSWSNINLLVPDVECQYLNNEEFDGPEVKYGTGKRKYADEFTPCWLKRGYGLYMLASDENGGWYDPDAHTYHLADTDNDGYAYYDKPSAAPFSAETDQYLHLKILDTYYDDNYGYYFVKIKEGTKPGVPGPIETVINAIKDPVDRAIELMYKNLVGEKEDGSISPTSFTRLVQACLVLYIVLYSLSFLLGIISNPQSDFFIRILKVGIITQLIGPGSWEFFSQTLFKIFTEGTAQIGTLVAMPFSGFVDYDPQHPWLTFDALLRVFTSEELFAKVFSLLEGNYIGLLYIFVLLIIIITFILTLLKAVMLYITAYIGFLLIALGPIFITFILFGKLKRLFDEWLGQLASNAMQIIIVFAAIGMFGSIIMYFLQLNLGFTVCWMPSQDGNWAWQPFAMDPDWIAQQVPFKMDFNGDGVVTTETRFFDLPYWDLEDQKYRISTVLELRDGAWHPVSDPKMVEFGHILLFYICVFIMSVFMSIVPTMSEQLRFGGKYSSASLYSGGGGLGGTLWGGTLGAVFGNKAKNAPTTGVKTFDKATGVYHKLTGRSGGLMGGLVRAPISAGKQIWDTEKRHKEIDLKEKKERQQKSWDKFQKERQQNIDNIKQANADKNAKYAASTPGTGGPGAGGGYPGSYSPTGGPGFGHAGVGSGPGGDDGSAFGSYYADRNRPDYGDTLNRPSLTPEQPEPGDQFDLQSLDKPKNTDLMRQFAPQINILQTYRNKLMSLSPGTPEYAETEKLIQGMETTLASKGIDINSI